MQKPLIVISGPTATGKTKLGVSLAKKIGGEIISGDSMQVYKGMDIGTAKVREEEKEGIAHYMIDEFEPDENCSVAVFQQMVKSYMNKIYKKGKIPIIVGGTGFYIRAITHDIEFQQTEKDNSVRDKLMEEAREYGPKYMHKRLRELDPESADNIHPNNIQRVVRAIEYYNETGEPISLHNKREKNRKSPYNLLFFALNMDRQLLYSRINDRVDQMIEDGLVEEAKYFFDLGYSRDLPSMRGIGYKEFYPYFEGKKDFSLCVDDLKQNTRKYAKRQLTWLRHQADPVWINVDKHNFDSVSITEELLSYVRKYNIFNFT